MKNIMKKFYNNVITNPYVILFCVTFLIMIPYIFSNKYIDGNDSNFHISNIFSIIIIQFIASILFGVIAYTFIKEPIDIIKIIMIRYLVSLVVGLVGTIVIITT